MRNLTVHRIGRRDLQLKTTETNPVLLEHVQCAINPNSNDIYMLLDDHIYLISRNKNDIIVHNFSQYYPSHIIALEYCITLQELYCAYDSGYIAKIDIKDSTRMDYNIIMRFDNGLHCMKLSPDHELIAAVTNTGIVITMVLDFQIMSEVILGFNSSFYQILLLSCLMSTANCVTKKNDGLHTFY